MSDDLDRLAAALKAAPPAADADARAAALARAMESFDRHQETRPAPRPSQDRPKGAGFLNGVLEMIDRLTQRPALAATVSVVALGAVLLLALPPVPTALTPAPGGAGGTAQRGDATAAGDTGLTQGRATGTDVAPPVPEADGQAVRDRSAGPAADAAADALLRKQAEAPATLPAQSVAPEESLGAVAGTVAGIVADTETGATAMMTADGPPRNLGRLAAENFAETGRPAPVTAEPLPLPSVIARSMTAPQGDTRLAPAPDTESFASAAANPLKVTAEEPVSTFGADVDTASYAVVRNSLAAGQLPPPEAVRIEEMVNYFPYAYPQPAADGAPFRADVAVTPTPWNSGTQLVRIGLQGRMPAPADRPPLNLVFLIDTSGSMDEPAKLPLLVQSFRLMLGQLREADRVAIVTYAGSAGLVLPPTPAAETATISAALGQLAAGGGTAGQAGLEQAYAVAETMAADGPAGAVSRVVLATDGDFNLGLSDPEALTGYIAARRDSGTFLSVLGFGRGNLDDATMQALAQNGNGQAAYIDTLAEAQKVLVDQLTGALVPIASDLKLQVEWNPAEVAEYRLIGYETRALAREDFGNDKVDAGDIGAGHQVTALYEITPVGSPAIRNESLRYGAEAPAPAAAAGDAELGFLKMRWKTPGASTSTLSELPITADAGGESDDLRFAAAIAGMGQLLTGATYLGDWGWDEAITLATGARGPDAYGYRAEAVQLMRLAQSLSAR